MTHLHEHYCVCVTYTIVETLKIWNKSKFQRRHKWTFIVMVRTCKTRNVGKYHNAMSSFFIHFEHDTQMLSFETHVAWTGKAQEVQMLYWAVCDGRGHSQARHCSGKCLLNRVHIMYWQKPSQSSLCLLFNVSIVLL